MDQTEYCCFGEWTGLNFSNDWYQIVLIVYLRWFCLPINFCIFISLSLCLWVSEYLFQCFSEDSIFYNAVEYSKIPKFLLLDEILGENLAFSNFLVKILALIIEIKSDQVISYREHF